MAHTQHSYQPDYAPPPGKTLEEFIEARDLSARELARRCGRSAKLVVEIIAGKAPIEPETAMQLERVLGMDASVWLNMEAAYRLHLARAEEADLLKQSPHPTRDEIITHMSTNICRCGTYSRIVRAIERAAREG
jgi:HTH-type transcriptional regulator/antitoxin HigA